SIPDLLARALDIDLDQSIGNSPHAKIFRERNGLDRLGACQVLIREQATQGTRQIVAQVLEESSCPSLLRNRRLVSAGDNIVAGQVCCKTLRKLSVRFEP